MPERRQDSEDDSEGETLFDTDDEDSYDSDDDTAGSLAGRFHCRRRRAPCRSPQSKNQKRYQNLIIHAVYNSFNKKCSIEASNRIEERTTNCVR